MIKIDWSQFKYLIDNNLIRSRYIETTDGYEVHGSDMGLVYGCNLLTGTDDCTDFVDNYKEQIKSKAVASVQTAFEADYLVLKMAKISGQADANGDATLSIVVPGSIANVERYAAGGYAFTDDYDWNDAITKVEIIDVNGVTGLPAGTVLKSYHDDEVGTTNQGWYFWKSHGTEGECEIEPIGWYGQINGELELKVTFKLKANAKVKADIWWGKKE